MDKNDKTTNLSEEMEQVSKSEKMIPLSAVAPLLGWTSRQLVIPVEDPRTGETDWRIPKADLAMVVAFDVAAKAAGWKTSAEILAPYLNSEDGWPGQP